MNIITKGLSYLVPPKTFKESPKCTADLAAKNFREFLSSNPWRRANVASDVFEKASAQIAKMGGDDAIAIPRGANVTILKNTHLPETIYSRVSVGGVLRYKSNAILDNLLIHAKGKVIGLPFADKIINYGTLKKLGSAKKVENWGKLRAAGRIDYLSNANSATGYVKDATKIKNYGEIFVDDVTAVKNSGVLFFQNAGKIDNHGGYVSGKSAAYFVKNPDKDGVDKGIYNIGTIGETTTAPAQS